MKNKRVLFIGNFLSRKRGTCGPTEYTADKLAEEGYKIYKASSYENKILRFLEMLLKVTFCNFEIIYIDTYSSKHAFMYAKTISYIAKMRNRKVFLTLHGGGLVDRYTQNPKQTMSFFRRADRIYASSYFFKTFFDSEGLNVTYLPNPIDFSRFKLRDKIVDNHSLLWVRAFCEMYNPILAVETLYETLKIYPDATLTMVGPDKGLLLNTKKRIKELGIEEKINITGKVPNDKLLEYYHSHKVFVNTTSYEGFGMAVMEAAVCGIPIVSTAVGELPYLWNHGENILLVKNFDPKEIAECVCRYFRDEDLYLSVLKNASNKSLEYNWETVKIKWFNLLNT